MTKKTTSNNDKINEQKNGGNKTKNNTIIDYSDLMDTKDVCVFLHIGIDTLYKWIEKGMIPHYRITGKKILFSRTIICQWLNEKMVG